MGIPIADENHGRRTFPIITWLIIIINIAVFIVQISQGKAGFEYAVMQYGMMPIEILTGKDVFPYVGFPVFLTMFSSMFMHANWMHLLGNMLYMYVFADNLEDRMGKFRFIVYYLLCGVLACAAQTFASWLTGDARALYIPCIGASGAIAGVMGGYLLLFPHARIITLMGWLGLIVLPAWAVLGLWIVTQILSGVATFGGSALGGVAYAAHVGGFIAGFLLIHFFEKPFRIKSGRWQR